MKKSKILAPALAILCLSTAASVTGTVAWFAANNVVTADGMAVRSTLPSSLAINSTFNPIGNNTTVTIIQDVDDLNPCSHWGADNEGTVVEGTGGALYRVTNGQAVNPETGLAYVIGEINPETGEAFTAEDDIPELEFEAVNDDLYFSDFTVYIGSVGEALVLGTGGYLEASVTFSGANMSATNQAVSMDFYYTLGAVTASIGTYAGSLNAAGVDAAQNHSAYTPAAELDSIHVISAGTIPVASSPTDALKITMRVYYDGALRKSATETYVATDTALQEQVNMEVQFSLNRGDNNN